MKETLSAVSGIIFLLGYIPYIRSILRGETKPCKASWIIWTVLDITILAGMYLKHALNGQIIGAFAGSLIVVILALKYGAPGWSKLDKACLAVAAVSIPLGLIEPTITVVINSIIVFIGGIPTFISMWKDPRKESRVAWALYALSCVPALLAVSQWTWADATQPVSYAAGEVLIIYLLFIRPFFKPLSYAAETKT